jgi:zeaxanthin glucosyltransferase
MRFLLVSSPEKGHLHPLIGVAQRLQRLGHHVGWLGLPRPADQLRELAIEQISIEADLPPEPKLPATPLATLVRDPGLLRDWVARLLLGSVDAWVPPVRKALEAFRPDVLAIDPMQYAAVIAAEQLGLPYGALSSSLNPVTPPDWECDLTRTLDALAPARSELFARHGLHPTFRVSDALSPYLNVVFSTEAYVDVAHLPPRTRLVGPSRPIASRGDETAFPWDRLDAAWPLVYVSFGSQIAHQPAIFQTVAEAGAAIGAQVVINCGPDFTPRDIERLPGRVVGLPYAPQLAILERATAMVSHGGANSVMEAHLAGVPLLLSPVCNDQPLQARFLVRSGAGVVLDLFRASVAEATEALASVLSSESPCRRAQAPITASYRAHDGAAEAARLLVELGA